MYDDRVEVYRMEKKKTEKLLTDLLPRQILRQMKRGQVNILNYTVFLYPPTSGIAPCVGTALTVLN